MSRLLSTQAQGQTVIEFTFCFSVFLLLLIGIFSFGVGVFERNWVDYQLSQIGGTIDVWIAQTDGDRIGDEEVKELICKGTTLDADLMEVDNAKAEFIAQNDTSYGDVVAGGLGNDQATRTARYLKVEADVSYVIGKGLIGTDRYERHVTRTFTMERRYEIS